jgi:hypothetical protein
MRIGFPSESWMGGIMICIFGISPADQSGNAATILSGIAQQGKLIITVIAGLVAAVAALRRDLDALVGRHSTLDHIKREEERLNHLDKLLADLGGRENSEATQKALEDDRRLAYRRLENLTREYSRRRKDPNYDLTLIQRLGVLFRPEGNPVDRKRMETIKWLVGGFALIGLAAFLCWSVLGGQNFEAPEQKERADDLREFIADFMLLGGCGVLLFRAWALAERRLAHGYRRKSTILRFLLVLPGPYHASVRWAQVCLWLSGFWIIEGAVDFAQDATTWVNRYAQANGSESFWPTEHLSTEQWLTAQGLKVLVPLVGALMCRRWLAAELIFRRRPIGAAQRHTAFLRAGWSSVTVLLCLIGTGVSICIAWLGWLYPADATTEESHNLALIVQFFIMAVAYSQWFALTEGSHAAATKELPLKRVQSAKA